MISLTSQGKYTLAESFGHTKILNLDDEKNFAWVNAEGIGELLVSSKKRFNEDNVLAIGKYRLYRVKDEPDLTDLTHLELSVGEGRWQGYLLPVGMPNGQLRRRIIPTKEIISKTMC